MIIPDELPDVDDLCIDPTRHGINIDGSVLDLSTFTDESTGPTELDNLSQKVRVQSSLFHLIQFSMVSLPCPASQTSQQAQPSWITCKQKGTGSRPSFCYSSDGISEDVNGIKPTIKHLSY